jgi:hypothetical protein
MFYRATIAERKYFEEEEEAKRKAKLADKNADTKPGSSSKKD